MYTFKLGYFYLLKIYKLIDIIKYMAETIEHRLQTLARHNVPIYSVEDERKHKVRIPFASMTSSDRRPDEGMIRLLGYFSNRGYESVEGWRSSKVTDEGPRLAAMAVGQSLGLKGFEDYSNDVDLEIHSVYDPQTRINHYFLLPHRRYLDQAPKSN